jgi:hypothetical protein
MAIVLNHAIGADGTDARLDRHREVGQCEIARYPLKPPMETLMKGLLMSSGETDRVEERARRRGRVPDAMSG